WTMPLAFGLPYTEVKTANTLAGNRIEKLTDRPKQGSLPNAYAYTFKWNEFYAPKFLYRLQSKGVVAKVATKPFKMNVNGKDESFGFGTIVIPSAMQKVQGANLTKLIEDASAATGVEVYPLVSGLAAGGIDIGSSSFVNLRTPQVMMFAGVGTSPTDVGEIWHMLDTRYNVPVSIVDVDRFGSINIMRYNVIIMPSGGYNSFSKAAQDKLRDWISAGGTLIATEDAVKWLSVNGFTKTIFKTSDEKRDSTIQLPYYLRSDETRAKDMAGSIFEAKVELTHPLGYGYTNSSVSVFKSNTLFMDKNNGPYDSPVIYTDNPLQSGYLYRGYKTVVKNSAAVNVDVIGRGRVISMVDNLTFRAFWLGTNKMFMNAIYFGALIN
ncbi:MAG TPA: hypothetical protein VLA58_05170, partial [Chitinophagaceae bacterium]|nr:hypothetical protein [Chitinophagaceae bacterium]